MFQLTDEEWKNQRSQFVIFNKDTRKNVSFVIISTLYFVNNVSKAINSNTFSNFY